MKQTSDTRTYDAIVVGSGATGGWTAKVMTEAGMDVLMLEAGRAFDPEKDFREHTLPHDMELRGRPDPRNELLQRRQRQSYCYACTEVNADFFIDDVDNPYTEAPGTHFNWNPGQRRRRPLDHVGAAVVPDERLRLQGREHGRLRHGLADQLCGHRPLLRPDRALHRRQRPQGGSGDPARRRLPAADGLHLRRGDAEGDPGDQVQPGR